MATPNPTTPPIVTTAAPAQNDFSNYSSQLQNALGQFGLSGNPNTPAGEGDVNAGNYSDPYTKALDALGARSDAATKALISGIQAKRDASAATLGKTYEDYKRGIQLLGIQHNEAQSSPDLLQGHIQQVTNDHLTKLDTLNAEEAKSLMDATDAQQKNQLGTLKQKMDYVKTIQTARNQSLKDTYDQLATGGNLVSSDQASKIYSTLQTLDPADKELFLQKVAETYHLPLHSLVKAVVAQHVKSTKGSSKGTGSGKKFSPSDAIANLTPMIEKIKGADGYIDPDAWVAGRRNWMKLGGSASSYNSNFKQYLNPESYSKAGFQPKKTSSSNSSSSS